MKQFLQGLYERRIKAFYERYERWFVPGTLLAGFVLDVVTFRSLQLQTTFLLLGGHALLAGFVILYNSLFDGDRIIPHGKVWRVIRALTPFAVQLSLGSLLSASLIFYWYSGAIFASWPLFLLLVLLMTTSEVFRDFYLQPIVQIGLYVFVIFSYFSILFPYLFKSLAPWVFVLAGGASLVITLAITWILARYVITVRHNVQSIVVVIVVVVGAMNGLYFLNIIPPIPLSVREAGIYHDIQISNGEYTLVGDTESFFGQLIPGQAIVAKESDNVFAYTAIYAPADLTTVIYHQWQFHDPQSGKWVDKDRLSFAIHGGRTEGFRGYTFKSRLTPGRWRVTVETARGQILGRVPFTVTAP